MNSKTVLNKILAALSLIEEVVEFTDAKDAQGNILQSPTFDLGETVEVVSEDGTKTPAPDGEHEIALRDSEGNEVVIRIQTKDGKITERENVEEANPADMKKHEDMAEATDEKVKQIPQADQKDKVNEVPDAEGSIKSGTLNMEEETEEVETIPEDDEKEEKEVEINLGDLAKKLEDMAYRIEEMEKKIKMEDVMEPPVNSEVTEEEAGIKMSEVEDEELPKLDGAPIDEKSASNFSDNRKNYGKKATDTQSSFLSKLYK